ncbi:hypothetical protein [Streptomyces sp. PRh5]|uniref:hypothetical protein n=1 Tax=Streptomyces sp. PRh5 TaxID=1158056 RepID=UPI0012FEF6C8|nr:hypothetical protein [Streptomyces sp. PRh5]
MVFNLVATGLSVVALLVTLYSAVSQAGLQRRSNQLLGVEPARSPVTRAAQGADR